MPEFNFGVGFAHELSNMANMVEAGKVASRRPALPPDMPRPRPTKIYEVDTA